MFSEEDKPLSEVFNEVGELVYKKTGSVLIIDSKEVKYISPDIAKILNNPVRVVLNKLLMRDPVKKIIKKSHKYINKESAGATASIDRSKCFNNKLVHVIAFDEREDVHEDAEKYNKYMQLVDYINHEVGHFHVENGWPVGELEYDHWAESAAEAHMAILHKQTFGNDTDFVKNHNMAWEIVNGYSPMHYTDIIAQKVDNLAKEVDLKQLTYDETVELAGEIAAKYHLDEKKLKKITKAFSPSLKTCMKRACFGRDTYKECFEVMRKTKDHDVFRVGLNYLNDYDSLEHTSEQLLYGGDYWVDALEYIDKFQKDNEFELDASKLRDEELGDNAITPAYVQSIVDNRKPWQCKYQKARQAELANLSIKPLG